MKPLPTFSMSWAEFEETADPFTLFRKICDGEDLEPYLQRIEHIQARAMGGDRRSLILLKTLRLIAEMALASIERFGKTPPCTVSPGPILDAVLTLDRLVVNPKAHLPLNSPHHPTSDLPALRTDLQVLGCKLFFYLYFLRSAKNSASPVQHLCAALPDHTLDPSVWWQLAETILVNQYGELDQLPIRQAQQIVQKRAEKFDAKSRIRDQLKDGFFAASESLSKATTAGNLTKVVARKPST